MKHIIEVFQTLGASEIKPLEENINWSFWEAVYPTPVSAVSGYYLYLKSTCTNKEGNEENCQRWRKLSKEQGYELIVTPSSDFAKNYKKAATTFKAKQTRTTKQLLIDNFMPNLKLLPITSEEYFIDPTLELENEEIKQDTTQFLISWITGKEKATKGASISALIAHGGVGKTTVSRVLCKALHKHDPSAIPILIESEQWRHLLSSSISLSNLWDIAISRRFENATRLLSNEITFRVLVREGLFVIIFDGFDELCVNSYSSSKPKEIINELIQLLSPEDEDVKAKIVITARKTYWDALTEETEEINFNNIEIFQLRGFNQEQRKSYFAKRLSNQSERNTALRISKEIGGGIYEGDEIEKEEHNFNRLSGVPFILDLIAQYVHKNKDITINPYQVDPLSKLLEDICRRENRRQRLNIEPNLQLTLFEELFRDKPELITISDLRFYLECICNVTDLSVVNDFTKHTFLIRTEEGDFTPRYEVLRVYFVARFLANSLLEIKSNTPRLQIAQLLAKNVTGTTQVIDWLIKQLKVLDRKRLLASIHHAIEIINDILIYNSKEDINSVEYDAEMKTRKDIHQQSSSALFHIVTNLIDSNEKTERTLQLCEFYKIKRISNNIIIYSKLTFKSIIKAFDFSNVEFNNCTFIDVEFKNCILDSSSFISCTFENNLKFTSCSTTGNIETIDCKYSSESEYALDVIRNSHSRTDLKQSFAEDALSRALRKFRRDNRFTTIRKQNQKTGFKVGNPYNDVVWDELFKAKIVQLHAITGATRGEMEIIEDKDIRREVSSFLDNGVLGQLLTSIVNRIIV